MKDLSISAIGKKMGGQPMDGPMDGPMDRPMDGRTDPLIETLLKRPSYRDPLIEMRGCI